MPITQARMKSLILAADAYQCQCRAFAHILARLHSGEISTATAIQDYNQTIADLDNTHYKVIAREDAHFAAWAGKNERHAKRQRDLRKQTAPKPDWKAATIAHNKIVGNAPTREQLEDDVAEFLAIEEALKNTTGTNP